jgi:hypothetical protein
MWHHKAPHRPWVPDEKYRREFATRTIPEPRTLWDDYRTRTDALHENQQRVAKDLTRRDLKLPPPPALEGAELNAWLGVKPEEVVISQGGQETRLTGDALVRWKYQRYMQDYLACVQSVDDGVGRVLDFLKSSGLENDTLVVYTSDQGFYLGDHGLFDKRFMYEESLRTPLLVRWPAAVKPGSKNALFRAEHRLRADVPGARGLPEPLEMQGRSLVPLLRGRKPAGWRESIYYRYYHDPATTTPARTTACARASQADLLLEEGPVGALRPAEGSERARQPLRKAGQERLTAQLKAELQRLKRELKDDDQLANQQIPNGVDGTTRDCAGRALMTILHFGPLLSLALALAQPGATPPPLQATAGAGRTRRDRCSRRSSCRSPAAALSCTPGAVAAGELRLGHGRRRRVSPRRPAGARRRAGRAVYVRDAVEHRLILRLMNSGRLVVDVLSRSLDDASRNTSTILFFDREGRGHFPLKPAEQRPLRVSGAVRVGGGHPRADQAEGRAARVPPTPPSSRASRAW